MHAIAITNYIMTVKFKKKNLFFYHLCKFASSPLQVK